MKEVKQVRVGFGIGQCTEATIASILELELDEVPDLFTGDLATPRSESKWMEMHDFIHNLGYQMVAVEFNHIGFSLRYDFYQKRLLKHKIICKLLKYNKYFGIAGRSPHGIGHMVVGKFPFDIAWDPNPGKNGLTTINGMIFLSRFDQINMEWQAWPSVKIDLYQQEE